MNRKEFFKALGMGATIWNLNTLKSMVKLEDGPSEKMPVLFLGHGSPMNALEDNEFVKGFRKIAQEIQKPKAILCISAHWYIRGTKILSSAIPKQIYDFGGFPDELYQVKYEAKGSPEFAREVAQYSKKFQTTLDDQWGLDHGAWTVLMHLYPKADIPIIQMSIDYTKPPSYHYELAQSLKILREKGILIIGSGNIIHNLGMIDWQNMSKDNYGFEWAIEMREKSNKAIVERNDTFLIDFHKNGKAFQNGIPTPDHYLPLIYTLGLSEKKEEIKLFNDKLMAGSLSMTSVKFG